MSFWRRKREAELEEEVRSHLEMTARERVARGETTEEAKHAARREFGNVGLLKEMTRDQWGWRWLEDFIEDARYGLRRMCKSHGFTAIAALSLALGIGANTTIFTLVNAVLLNPLPVEDPSSTIALYPFGNAAAAARTVQPPIEWPSKPTFSLSTVASPRR